MTERLSLHSLSPPVVKNLPANARGVRKISLEKKMATHSSILAEFHGQRILVSYSPLGLKELDTTEHAHTHTRIILTIT